MIGTYLKESLALVGGGRFNQVELDGLIVLIIFRKNLGHNVFREITIQFRV